MLETNAIFRKFSLSSALLIKADERFSIYRYRMIAGKSFPYRIFSSDVDNDYIENDKGYRIDGSVKSGNVSGYMKPSDKKEKIPIKNKPYPKSIKELCEENGAQLMLVSTPSLKTGTASATIQLQSLPKNSVWNILI